MTKKEMIKGLKENTITVEMIKGLTLKQLQTLDDLLVLSEPTEETDLLINAVVEEIKNKNKTEKNNSKKVASEKNNKKKNTLKAPKVSKEDAPKEEGKKEEPKKEEPKAPKAPKEEKQKEAPTEASKDLKKNAEAPKVDFSKYNGYQLTNIFRSPYNALSKEDKKVHTALNKEYEGLKRGDKVQIKVKDDINEEYDIATCLIVFRDNVSAIAVDIETGSKYEINRIQWALKEIVKHIVHEDGAITTMYLEIKSMK